MVDNPFTFLSGHNHPLKLDQNASLEIHLSGELGGARNYQNHPSLVANYGGLKTQLHCRPESDELIRLSSLSEPSEGSRPDDSILTTQQSHQILRTNSPTAQVRLLLPPLLLILNPLLLDWLKGCGILGKNWVSRLMSLKKS